MYLYICWSSPPGHYKYAKSLPFGLQFEVLGIDLRTAAVQVYCHPVMCFFFLFFFWLAVQELNFKATIIPATYHLLYIHTMVTQIKFLNGNSALLLSTPGHVVLSGGL